MISDPLANCCSLRALVVVAALVLPGCAPSNIARSSCSNTVLAVHDIWTCTVTGQVVGQTNSIEFDTESRNQIAQVNIELQVTKGTLRVRYHDLAGPQQIVVTPSEPARVEMKTKMHPERRSFTLVFEPVNGNAEGLTGTVKYRIL